MQKQTNQLLPQCRQTVEINIKHLSVQLMLANKSKLIYMLYNYGLLHINFLIIFLVQTLKQLNINQQRAASRIQ